ncbi:MAG: winged helix-turn-helix domain-containing protein, partial [Bacteroidota bacterium]
MSNFATQFMIETLISSKTRIKLLLKFFINSKTTAYLRSLESEFGESTNAIRVELNRLEDAGMLESYSKGNKKIFKANIKHPLFSEIHSILLKHIGIDKIIENVINRLGAIEKVFLVGDFSKGKNSKIIDLILIGKIDKNYLVKLIDKAEKMINRKVRYLIYEDENKFRSDVE